MTLTDEQARALVKAMTDHDYSVASSKTLLKHILPKIEALGFAIVPVDPTEAMREAWCDLQPGAMEPDDDWAALLKAGKVKL